MRKLITYFMLTTVGKHWASEHLPKTVEIAIDRSKRKQYRDILHQVDFSQLSDFLFKKYPTRKLMDDLFAQLGEAESSEDLDLQELQV